jgi:hypothetical protein
MIYLVKPMPGREDENLCLAGAEMPERVAQAISGAIEAQGFIRVTESEYAEWAVLRNDGNGEYKEYLAEGGDD